MNEATQVVVSALTFATTLTTALVGYLVYEIKRLNKRLAEVEKRLDISRHKNYLVRVKLNRVIDAFKSFRNGVFEVMETSFREKRPVTKEQIERLKRDSDIDEILGEGSVEGQSKAVL